MTVTYQVNGVQALSRNSKRFSHTFERADDAVRCCRNLSEGSVFKIEDGVQSLFYRKHPGERLEAMSSAVTNNYARRYKP